MPYRKIFFEKHQPFHIFSHAVEERNIFDNEADCYRFIFQIYAANIGKPAPNLWKKDIIKAAQALLQGEEVSSKFIIKQHLPFVDILDFALVVNHYHFYLASNIENSIPFYMQKLNMGFAKYFNLKYGRNGSLFGSRYKSILVKTERQSVVVSRYVNIINPLDVYQPGWRERGLKDGERAFKFLKNYQFSSFPDKTGERRSKILAPKAALETYFPEAGDEYRDEYIQFIKDFLKDRLEPFQPFFLE